MLSNSIWRALAVLIVSTVSARAMAAPAPYLWRTFDLALEMTEQDSRSSAGPRVRFAPSKSFDIDVPRIGLLVSPFLSYSVLKTASSGKIGALTYGAGVGAEYDQTYDLRWNFAAASWAGDNGTALLMGPELGYRLHLGEGWAASFDRVFVAANGIWQSPYVRQYILGLQFQF